jgi:tetratricopeptide (TPR) repeat protein
VVVALAAAGFYVYRQQTALPQPGSDTYEQTTRAFYHGISALQVGLLEDAKNQFSRATELTPEEPAAWANLALSHLRLGDLDGASAPMERALALAPDHPAVALLAGRMEAARGRLDEGIALLRRAAQLEVAPAVRARAALAEELERTGEPENETEALRVLDEILERAPSNVSVIVERARIAAKRADFTRLNDSLARLKPFAAAWPPIAVEQMENLQRAATANAQQDAARASNLLRNVLARVPTFIESLVEVRTPAELVADPIDRYIALAAPPSTPAAPDTALTYGPPSPLPGFGETSSSAPALELDWNHDLLIDRLTTIDGRLRLEVQGPEGTFTDRTPADPPADVVAAWAADVEMDGDLDLIVGRRDGDPVVLRNNGDGSWRPITPFTGVPGARAFAWADFDGDADPDAALLDAVGNLHVFENRQAGDFTRVEVSGLGPAAALAVADLDADGAIDIVALESDGAIKRLSGLRDVADVAAWSGMPTAVAGAARLLTGDLDNNGAVDVVATAGGDTRIWLSDTTHAYQPLAAAPRADVTAIVDVDADGLLDLAALQNGTAVVLTAKGAAGYHWKTIRPRAQQQAGDQRINSFGIGGDVEVRSGLLVQKQVIAGSTVHLGLGTRTSIDVIRIVWPNGVPQAEFGEDVDKELVAEQRLKGSCPWVFAWDGASMRFVTDFLWRSPLGLRINAQDTAGVVQTEDWVRIPGEALSPRDGVYDVRITAELWETHFFDHVSLLVVDHPEDDEVYVDERFSAAAPPALEVKAFRHVTPVTSARDEKGRDVSDLVRDRDGRYLATFAKGRYQGIAEPHYVEIDLPAEGRLKAAPAVLLAYGWIYPTDSSINVAIGQGSAVRPEGLSLEAQYADGRWVVVNPDLGFPAGKNKTIVIDLARAAGARRLRLRTNLEIYWDLLAFASRAPEAPRTTRLPLSRAELRYRGFSATTSQRGDGPETPDYGRVESTSPRWRDLAGYHTRFGDVIELLTRVDDRYVIMNAGDEMRLTFPAQAPPPAGWRRDFVLIGDGWEKDGDYNTGFSQTVLPLPSHADPAYGSHVGAGSSRGSDVGAGSSGGSDVGAGFSRGSDVGAGFSRPDLQLEDDPVYKRHPGDWERYHTRYVTPRAFIRGVR